MKLDTREGAFSESNVLSQPSWQARLALGFAHDQDTTRLVKRVHYGPLRVQKPLYPEGSHPCHAIIVHPPGGVVGGDELNIEVEVGDKAHALITTPGAAKWYKANGKISTQQVQIEIGAGAKLEWLPQETIFFKNAHVRLETDIALAEDARFIGCEVLCFGRTASGEIFDAGTVFQRTRITRAGKLLWLEQGALSASAGMMKSPLGLDGKTACGTLIAIGKTLNAAQLSVLRAGLADAIHGEAVHAEAIADSTGSPEAHASGLASFGVTQLKSVLVVRCLSHSSEVARRIMVNAWKLLRPTIMERAAVTPRIWNT